MDSEVLSSTSLQVLQDITGTQSDQPSATERMELPKEQMEVENTENKEVITVFVKDEPNDIQELENEYEEEFQDQDVSSYTTSCVVKEDPHVEEEKVEQLCVLPDVSTIVEGKDEELEEKPARKKIKEERKFDEYILPDGNTVIKEEDTGSEHETYLLPHDVVDESSQNTTDDGSTSSPRTTARHKILGKIDSVSSSEKKKSTGKKAAVLPDCRIKSGGSKKLYKCKICNRTYTQNNRARHQLIHSGLKRYPCDLCEKTFSQAGSLVEHKLLHSGVKNYKCNVCEKAFTKAWDLQQHKLVIHLGIRRHQCDVCNRTFSAKRDLADHKLLHAGVAKYQCNICNKTLSSKKILARHKSLHDGIRKYQCNVCDRSFNQSGGLTTHKLTHIKRFLCDVCCEAFTRPRDLTQHKLVHFGVKYQCTVCNKAFTKSSGLYKHNKQFHNDDVKQN